MTTPDFLIPMEALHNLRAVQGYTTSSGSRMRKGRLYRSGAWERATEADRAWLDANVQTIVDLRHPDEVSGAEAYRRGEPPASVVFHSVFDPDLPLTAVTKELSERHGPGITASGYLHYLNAGGAGRIARVVELLAEETRYPVLMSCTAGKDRTGILVAMLMDVLGIDDEVIAAEYARSDADIDGMIEYLQQVGRPPGDSSAQAVSDREAPVERMLGFLEAVRAAHGSVAELLASNGVSDDTVERGRQLLLEDSR
jgi:hypothetical protein